MDLKPVSSVNTHIHDFQYLTTIRLICCDNVYCHTCYIKKPHSATTHVYYGHNKHEFYLKCFYYDDHGPCTSDDQRERYVEYILSSGMRLFKRMGFSHGVVEYMDNYQSRIRIQIACGVLDFVLPELFEIMAEYMRSYENDVLQKEKEMCNSRSYRYRTPLWIGGTATGYENENEWNNGLVGI